jgi:hypothetical protein
MMEQKMNNRIPLNSIRSLAIAVLGTLLLSACASGPDIFVSLDPNADFSDYKTYNFASRFGTDDRDGYRSLFSQYLINAAEREMNARGYMKSDNPDLLINFGMQTKEKIRTTSSPTTGVGGYYGYRGYGYYGGYETTVTQYTEGTFNMDIVGAKGSEKQLLWECVLVGRITNKFREDMEGSVDEGMVEIFSNYPHYAAGFVPPTSSEEEK